MLRPFISVVIPAYNSAKSITRAIESAQKQKDVDVEIIVVDDASTDSTAEVVRNLQKNDSRIRLISHDTNKQVGQARNTGIEAAKADWIAFLDADDEWLPEKLIKQFREAIKSSNPENVFCFCYFKERKEDGAIEVPSRFLKGRRTQEKDQEYVVFDSETVRKDLMHSAIWFGGSSSLFAHKKALINAGGYDAKFAFCEDNYLVTKHILNKGERPLGEVRIVPEPLMIYTDPGYETNSDRYNPGLFPLRMIGQKCYFAQQFGAWEAKQFVDLYGRYFSREGSPADPKQIRKAMYEVCQNAPCLRGFNCGLKGGYCDSPSP
ncbi:MAG: glycosyltransferase [Alphaproteobacteria bacterium]|nr:glycosyltransferase [Alphaproteobacteria bacterium]